MVAVSLKKIPRRIKEQTEVNNTITEMKNTLQGINSRITEAEEKISDPEDRNGGIHCRGTE